MPSLDIPTRYLEWRARPALRRYVGCTWSGGAEDGHREPVLPDGCIDIIWDGRRLLLAGPDTGPTADEREGSLVVGLRFRPGAGPLFLGVPASELRDARVGLDRLWPDAPALADRLGEAASVSETRAILEETVAARLPTAAAPDPAVEFAARAWGARSGAVHDPATGPPALSASSLATRAGLSERQLHRRFVAAVGYGPKYLHRVLRFQAFLGLSHTPGLSLAELAYRCGFADQAHLTRETAALGGRTPAQLRAARRGDVRNVQDAD